MSIDSIAIYPRSYNYPVEFKLFQDLRSLNKNSDEFCQGATFWTRHPCYLFQLGENQPYCVAVLYFPSDALAVYNPEPYSIFLSCALLSPAVLHFHPQPCSIIPSCALLSSAVLYYPQLCYITIEVRWTEAFFDSLLKNKRFCSILGF